MMLEDEDGTEANDHDDAREKTTVPKQMEKMMMRRGNSGDGAFNEAAVTTTAM